MEHGRTKSGCKHVTHMCSSIHGITNLAKQGQYCLYVMLLALNLCSEVAFFNCGLCALHVSFTANSAACKTNCPKVQWPPDLASLCVCVCVMIRHVR